VDARCEEIEEERTAGEMGRGKWWRTVDGWSRPREVEGSMVTSFVFGFRD